MMSKIDPAKAKQVASWEHPEILYAICQDARNGRLYAGSADYGVHRVDLNADRKRTTPAWSNHDNYVSAMLFREGPAFEDLVVTGSYDGRLNWTRARDGERIRSVEAHDGWVRGLALFPGADRLASVGDDMLAKIWDAGTGELLCTMDGHPKQTPEGFHTALYALAVSPDGRYLASGDRIGEVRVWDAGSGTLLAELQTPEFYTYDAVKRSRSIGGIRALAFSSDGARLAIAGIGQVTNVDGFVGPCRVEVWDWQKGERSFVGSDSHKAVFNRVAFHAEESWIVAAGGGDGGGLIAFWDGKQQKPLHKAKLKGHIQDFCFDRSGTQLFAAGFGGVGQWDLTGNLAAPETNKEGGPGF